MASTSRGPLPGGPRTPTRSSPRHRPAWGLSQQGQSVPMTPSPLRAEQRFQTPARARPVLLTPTSASQAIGVVHQPVAG